MRKVIVYSCLILWIVFVVNLVIRDKGENGVEIVEVLNQSQLQNVVGTIEFVDKYKENCRFMI